MPTLHQLRDEDPDTHTPTNPPSPSSYILPLLLILAACAGYIFWRRRQQRSAGAFGLRNFSSGPAAVRLSVDDDGPAAHSFIVNNGSTDSLPSHALTDLPEYTEGGLSSSNLPLHPANQSSSHSLSDSYTPGGQGLPSTGLSKTQRDKGKAAGKTRGAVERDEDESDRDSVEADSVKKNVFDIGDGDQDDETEP